jgi:hypothetical protein
MGNGLVVRGDQMTPSAMQPQYDGQPNSLAAASLPSFGLTNQQVEPQPKQGKIIYASATQNSGPKVQRH